MTGSALRAFALSDFHIAPLLGAISIKTRGTHVPVEEPSTAF
jgi:hypothetical protein